jgi:hypothetical protein
VGKLTSNFILRHRILGKKCRSNLAEDDCRLARSSDNDELSDVSWRGQSREISELPYTRQKRNLGTGKIVAECCRSLSFK